MKTAISLFLGLIFSAAANASTVCSGPNLYYSNIVHKFGMQPPPGMETGKTVIVYNGEVLVNETHYAGLGGYSSPDYLVGFDGERVVLNSTGNSVRGSMTYEQTAVLNKVNPVNFGDVVELAREYVVCKIDWAHHP